MKKIKKIAALLVFVASGMSFAFSREITISVEEGQSWKKGHLPQAAIWLEDTNGNYIQTLYVTKKASKKSWIFAPDEGRPESLPVWYKASKRDSAKTKKKIVSKNDSQIDAVTSATPKAKFEVKGEIPNGNFVLKAEFNKSFDYNDTFTKKNSNDNGQPSLVYEAYVTQGENAQTEFKFLGTGSVDGSDGKIHKGTVGLTTAKDMVKAVTIRF